MNFSIEFKIDSNKGVEAEVLVDAVVVEEVVALAIEAEALVAVVVVAVAVAEALVIEAEALAAVVEVVTAILVAADKLIYNNL
jgi:hypothetical protein